MKTLKVFTTPRGTDETSHTPLSKSPRSACSKKNILAGSPPRCLLRRGIGVSRPHVACMQPFGGRTVCRFVRCVVGVIGVVDVVNVVGVVDLQNGSVRMSSDLEVHEAAGRFVLLSTDAVVLSHWLVRCRCRVSVDGAMLVDDGSTKLAHVAKKKRRSCCMQTARKAA